MRPKDFGLDYCYPNNNASCFRRFLKPELYLFLYIFAGFVTTVTICGNLLVIISVSHFKQLHTPSNLLVVSLAAADFLIGFFVMPFQFSAAIENCWYFKTFCSSYLTYAYILNAVSVANMVNISVDRYLAVYEPFFYSIKVTNNRMGIWILLCWFFMILYTLTFLYFTGADIVTSLCDGVCRLSHYVEWWIIHCVVMFILPFTLMICFYARVFIVAKTHAQAITDMLQKIKSIDRTKCNVSVSSERKAAKTLGIVVAVFIICWSPMNILDACIIFTSVSEIHLMDVLDGFIWLSCINSGINPVIYALFYPWFRKSLKLIITLKILNRDSSVVNLFPK